MADNTRKVVPLSRASDPGGSDDSHVFARVPAPFVQMKDKGKQCLQPLLQALFDNIDDALFELADRAGHNAEQNMYFESMREIRIKRRGMELGFARELDETFRQLMLGNGVPPVLTESTLEGEVEVDSLSLVADDELEELVAIDNMVAKAEREYLLPLKQLTTRLDTLVSGQAVTEKNNPFGPAIICQAFIRVCKELDIDIKAKLVLFKLFDRYVLKSMTDVYTHCNSVLVEGGILPKLDQRQSAAVQPGGQESAAAGTSASASHDVFADLQNLLHQTAPSWSGVSQANGNGQAVGGLVMPGQAPQIPRDTLMQLLQAVQQSVRPQMEQQHQAALNGVVPQQLDVQSYLSSLLSVKMPSRSMSIGQVDDDAINLVAMLFQFILDDRNLAPPMKALIARLQIPIIKVSMLDKSFFSKGGHPARKLLNEIANASLGWVPTSRIERDPLYNKVTEIVNRLLSESITDSALFQEVLADFVAFVDMDKRRTRLIEQRTVNAEDGKARSEFARTSVQTVLNQKVAGKSLPKVVITLLEEAWSNVLFLIYLKEGDEQKKWHDALRVVDELLWSVEPMDSQASRQRLLKLVPNLLKNLRSGLTKIGYNPFDMNQLFADLETIHLAQLKALNTGDLDLASPAPSTSVASNKADLTPAAKVQQTRVIEKTLDDMLEQRDSGGDMSLESLDAELDEQLAKFDALGDLVAQSADESRGSDAAVQANTETASVETVDDKLARHFVDKLVVNGAIESELEAESEQAADEQSLAAVDKLNMGNWVELHQEDGKKFRCRLAAIIRSTGKYIFVNRSGMKVAEYKRLSLAVAIKQGAVSTLDEGLLFDRALESVIGNLRDMKTSA